MDVKVTTDEDLPCGCGQSHGPFESVDATFDLERDQVVTGIAVKDLGDGNPEGILHVVMSRELATQFYEELGQALYPTNTDNVIKLPRAMTL